MSITCPTCQLMNDEEETSCRRCFTPLVVAVRGGAEGGTKAYSRRLIENAIQDSNFSWVRITTVCSLLIIAGFMLHRISLRLDKDSTQVIVSKPQVVPVLQMATRYQNNQLLVTNNDQFDWEKAELTVNHSASSDSSAQECCWTLIVPRIKSNETIALNLNLFKDKKGASFNPSANQMKSLHVSCSVRDKQHNAAAWFK
jgi:hypothetical protein